MRIRFFASGTNAPSGTALASFDFDNPGLVEGSRQTFTYSLTSPVEFAAGTTYWMVVSYVGVTGSIYTDKATSNVLSGGNLSNSSDGINWSAAATHELTFGLETCLVDTVVNPSIEVQL